MTEQKNNLNVPYIVFESVLDKQDRQQKRIIMVMGGIIIVLILLVIISNAVWFYEWNQYDYVYTESDIEVESDEGGNANYIGRDGAISNGKSESEDEDSKEVQEELERNED